MTRSFDAGRRRLLQGLGSLPALLSACSGGGGSSSGDGRPNVLMIVLDDLNDWVGFLGGHPQVQTPNMDRLAARSTVFRRGYTNAPLCNPSRSSALSGLSVQATRVFDNDTSIHKSNASAVDLPAWMGAHGYDTRLWGKIFHWFKVGNQPVPEPAPATNQKCSGAPGAPTVGLFDWAGLEVDESSYPDVQWTQQAIDYLGHAHAKPFFLGLGLLRTHIPWYVPRRFLDLYPEGSVHVPDAPPDDLDDLPPSGRATALALNAHPCITSQNLWASAVRGYLASISFADAQIGRLLDALDRSAYADNTLVILWSDHGYHLGEKFHWHKDALWERCTRIPYLISRPGQVAGASVDQTVVSLVDMMPTVLDLCGVPDPYPLAGDSLRPLLDDPQRSWERKVLITRGQYDYAIRSSRWRYIRYENGDRELYDETADPAEYRNLAEDPANAGVIAELDAAMPPRPA